MKKVMQAGFTIVELMVALLLSSLVVAAATQLFSANQQLFSTQQAVSRLMDDGQLLLRFMGNDIRRAGFSGGPTSQFSGVVFGGAGGSVEASPSDRLAIRFNGRRDCQGSVSATATDIVNVYSVVNGSLVCNGSLTQGSVALVDGVEGFRVLYGLDTDQDGAVGPFRYVGASAAAAADDPVIAIRIALLMAVPGGGLPENEERAWHLLDREIRTGTDRAVRRVFSSTFMLRNMDWEAL